MLFYPWGCLCKRLHHFTCIHPLKESACTLPVLVTVVGAIPGDGTQLFAIATQCLGWELILWKYQRNINDPCHYDSQMTYLSASKNVFCAVFQSCVISPSCRSSNPGPAWQDRSLPQTLLPVWCSTYRHEMFYGCTARRCWTWATHHPHTATAPGTDPYPAYAWWWISQWDSSLCQSSPVQQERDISWNELTMLNSVLFGFCCTERKGCVCMFVDTHRNAK